MKESFQYCPICRRVLELGVIDGKERKFCPNCDFIDYKNPLPVAVAIAVKGKKVLMIKRGMAPRKGAWGPPSGFIEVGETPEEACLRELKEETGVSGQVVRLVGVSRLGDKEVYGDMLMVRYLVKVGDEEITPGDEVEDARFFDIAELSDNYAKHLSDLIESNKNDLI
ncbi:MAG TPA: NUDIX hydrolase [Dehalococcoidia bacterium]|nr:NUDIX hydrolase [Dehalococcoidia bacterium]